MARMSMKSRRVLMTWCKLGVVMIFLVLFVTPIRNVVLSPFLPGCWLPHSTWRVVQMLLDNQHFPITSPFGHPAGPPPARFKFNASDVDRFLYKDDPFADYFKQREALRSKSGADRGPKAEEELALVESFQPVMSLKERAQLMYTMHVFQTVCRDHGIVFFIFEGSLLGSYRHHGLVPWDDDIDVAINASDWRKVRAALSHVPGFTLFAPPDSQWKFYLTDLPAFADKPFKFPYIDLFFFRQSGDYVWGITWGMKNHLMLKTKHLFPLTTVRWEMLTLPAPLCVRRMVVENYGLGCMTPKYVHKTNERRYGFQTDKVDCSRLHRYLPFVFRETKTSSGVAGAGSGGGKYVVVETRRVGGRALQNFTLPPPPDVCSED